VKYDVVVVGAGLAGLSAARDLMTAGSDVLVVEARNRPGGRVEQTTLADGRIVQLGGEVIGPFHESYLGLAEELGLTIVPSFPQLPGEDTWVLAEGRYVGDGFPWMSDADRASFAALSDEFGALARSVDPDDPWSHADADRLDRLSLGDWLRDRGATPNVVRARDLAMLALSAESVERTSLLAELRKEAAAGGNGFYNYDIWECSRVAEGSATVALRMADELGYRVRYGTAVRRIDVSPQGCATTTETGERFESDAVVCAIPVGPLRNVRVVGVSEERMLSLDRQRHALAAKVVFTYADSFWHDNGQNGDSYFETAVIGGTWVQREGIMSTLVPPERLAAFLTTSQAHLEAELTDEMVEAFGEEARATQAVFFRRWGVDPFTLGYITGWRPGDVMSVGPLHGTHEPPFYVCGSDQWVCGYMEGAVRTGRAAAATALGGLAPRASMPAT
jgi:monoamine oxidase